MVDEGRCMGHGRCTAAGPAVYVLDDLGFNRMGTFEVAEDLADQAGRGAMACPEGAIAVTDDDAYPNSGATGTE
jgi:ferredoxin